MDQEQKLQDLVDKGQLRWEEDKDAKWEKMFSLLLQWGRDPGGGETGGGEIGGGGKLGRCGFRNSLAR